MSEKIIVNQIDDSVATTTQAKPVTQQALKSKSSFYQRIKRVPKLFKLCVILPTLLSGCYFGVMASDIYISEAHFIVRSHTSQNVPTGLGALLQTTGFTRAQDESYTVTRYINSRDVMFKLNKELGLIEHYKESHIDLFSRFAPFGFNNNNEAFYEYLQNKIIVNIDSTSMISTLRVKAFSAELAHQINENILQMSESLINQLNSRARADTIGFATKLVEEAEKKVAQSADKLYQFRLQHGIFDLNRQTDSQLQLIAKLQDELIAVQTHLSQLKTVTVHNPQIATLKAREISLKEEISQQLAKVFGHDNTTYSNNAGEYEHLILEYRLAEQQLITAITTLEKAKEEAQRKQLYLERISNPYIADVPTEPNRLLNILSTLLLSLLAYGTLSLFIASVKEHKG